MKREKFVELQIETQYAALIKHKDKTYTNLLYFFSSQSVYTTGTYV